MARTRLTQARIAGLRPRKTNRDVHDTSFKGFGIRVYPTGRKCYNGNQIVMGTLDTKYLS